MNGTSGTGHRPAVDLRIGRQYRPSTLPRPVWALAAGAVSVGVVLLGLVLVAISPFVALWTGLMEIATQTRDTLMRPRPFVGARHGLPFLDPPPPPHRTGAPEPPANG